MLALEDPRAKNLLFVSHGIIYQSLNEFRMNMCPENASLILLENRLILRNIVRPALPHH